MTSLNLKKLACFFTLSSIFFFAHCSNEPQRKIPISRNGALNLEGWDFIQNGNIEVKGDWELYYEQFLSSEEINNKKGKLTGYVKFPGSWKGISNNGVKVSGYGYATLRMVIHLPEYPNISLKTGTIGTSYRLFLNGKKVAEGGEVGRTEEDSQPGFRSNTSIVHQSIDKKLEIIFHISNFADPNGGIWDSVFIGDTSKILQLNKSEYTTDIFLFSTIFAMSIYHFILFLLRRKDTSPLLFGLFCLFICIRVLLISERILHNDLNWLTWTWLFRMEFLTFYFCLSLFSGFAYTLYKEEFSLRIAKLIFIVTTVFAIIVTFTKPKFFTEINIFYELFSLVAVLYILFVFIKAFFKRRNDATYFIAGMVFIVLSLLHDILVSHYIIRDIYIFEYGLVVFILFQSTIIASRFSRAFTKSEELAESLIITNSSIARFVPSEFLKFLNKTNIVDVKLGDHLKQEMTIFFSDIRGFTSLSEKLNSEEVFEFLNDYFKRTINIIQNNGGFVDKIIGDGVMAIFPKSPNDAVKASREIQEQISLWNNEREQQGYPLISIGIGIHTGIVSMGTVGTDARLDTTVIGDTVNTASRLEALNKEYGTKIILSETSFKKLDPHWLDDVKELGSVRIRGREGLLSIYECFTGTKRK